MSVGTGNVRRTHSRGAIAGIALMLLLAGCTELGDPPVPAEASGGEQTPLVQPTGADPSGETTDQASDELDRKGPDVYRVDPTTGAVEPVLSAAVGLHEPELSPDGSRLLYQTGAPSGTQQIFVLEDGERRQLTHMPGGALEPTWSPDGSQIAFAGSLRAGEEARLHSDIFVMDADGGHVRRLAGTPEQDRRPDWSPDGSRIAFDTYGQIWAVSVRDGELSHLGPRAITYAHGPAADATWSPDGRWIAITRFATSSINGKIVFAGLWVMRPDGTGERPLSFPPKRPDFQTYKLDPSWSPDGNSIAFTDTSSSIGIIDMRTGEIAHIDTPLLVSDLSWGGGWILVSMGYLTVPSPSISAPQWEVPWAA